MLHIPGIGSRTPDVVDLAVEEPRRVVVGFALDVLWKGQESRSPAGGVQHHRKRLRERLDHLLGPGDAVPVAADRLEGVAYSDRRILEDLDLLEHRVDDAVLEGVAREDQ